MAHTQISEAKSIRFDDSRVIHIVFDKKSANTFNTLPNSLNVAVDNSASFLLLPFEQVKAVRSVAFQWKKHGKLKIIDAAHEQTKSGDDAYLRIGLLIKGQPELFNPLTPTWLNKVKAVLHHASNKMIFLVPGSHNQHGAQWKSPYNTNVDIIAITSEQLNTGWSHSKHVFKKPLQIVGLWIMADGDNTQSTFVSQLRELVLE